MKQQWAQSFRMKTADPVSVAKCMTQIRRILHELRVLREEQKRIVERRQVQHFGHFQSGAAIPRDFILR